MQPFTNLENLFLIKLTKKYFVFYTFDKIWLKKLIPHENLSIQELKNTLKEILYENLKYYELFQKYWYEGFSMGDLQNIVDLIKKKLNIEETNLLTENLDFQNDTLFNTNIDFNQDSEKLIFEQYKKMFQMSELSILEKHSNFNDKFKWENYKNKDRINRVEWWDMSISNEWLIYFYLNDENIFEIEYHISFYRKPVKNISKELYPYKLSNTTENCSVLGSLTIFWIKTKNNENLLNSFSYQQGTEFENIFIEKISLLFKEISKQLELTEKETQRKKINDNFHTLMKLLNSNIPDESISNSMMKAKKIQELYSQIDEIQKEIDKLFNET